MAGVSLFLSGLRGTSHYYACLAPALLTVFLPRRSTTRNFSSLPGKQRGKPEPEPTRKDEDLRDDSCAVSRAYIASGEGGGRTVAAVTGEQEDSSGASDVAAPEASEALGLAAPDDSGRGVDAYKPKPQSEGLLEPGLNQPKSEDLLEPGPIPAALETSANDRNTGTNELRCEDSVEPGLGSAAPEASERAIEPGKPLYRPLGHIAPSERPPPDARSFHKPRPPSRWQKKSPKAPGTREYIRYARLDGLAVDVTLADILAGLAATAPVGRVLDIAWDGRGVREKRGRPGRAAYVLFDHDAAPVDLVRNARQRTFRVCAGSGAGEAGEAAEAAVPLVMLWTDRVFHGNEDAPGASRVLCLRGPRAVEGFSAEAISGLLLGNAAVVKALAPLGLDAEAVETTDWGSGQRMIEWRFYSNERQCKVVLPVLRRHFYRQLLVAPGLDPCWNEKLYPRQRMNTHDKIHMWDFSKEQKAPSVRKRYLGDKENTLAPEEMVPPDPGQSDEDSSRKDWQIHWQDIKAKEPEPINWEDMPYDLGWEQDDVPWTGAHADPSQGMTPDHFEKMMAAGAKEKAKETLKPLDGANKQRVAEWKRVQKMLESRNK